MDLVISPNGVLIFLQIWWHKFWLVTCKICYLPFKIFHIKYFSIKISITITHKPQYNTVSIYHIQCIYIILVVNNVFSLSDWVCYNRLGWVVRMVMHFYIRRQSQSLGFLLQFEGSTHLSEHLLQTTSANPWILKVSSRQHKTGAVIKIQHQWFFVW